MGEWRWSVWHLTPDGWVKGEEGDQLFGGPERPLRRPTGCVLSMLEQVWSSKVYNHETREVAELWRSENAEEVRSLETRFGVRTGAPPRVPALVGKDLLAPIGQVAANYSVIEWLVEQLLWHLLFVPEAWERQVRDVGAPLTGRMSLDDLLSNLKILYPRRVADGDLQRRFAAVHAKAYSLKNERNAIIHARWGLPEHAQQGMAVNFKSRSREWERREWTAADVDAIAGALSELAHEILVLSKDTWAALVADVDSAG
jgi:hypothetical protein